MSNEIKLEIGGFLKSRRMKMGLTQQCLAENIGLKNASMIAQIEAGQKRVPADKIQGYANQIDIECGSLARVIAQEWEPALFDALNLERSGWQQRLNSSAENLV